MNSTSFVFCVRVSDLDHLVSILSTLKDTRSGSYRLVSKMWCNESVLVLDLERRLKESVHEAKSVLNVLEHSASINSLEVDIEESLSLAAFQKLLNLLWLL